MNLNAKLNLENKEEIEICLMKKSLYQQNSQRQSDNTKTPPKSLITQRLRTELGRSVDVVTTCALNDSWSTGTDTM